MDDVLELHDRLGFLADLRKGVALFEQRGRRLVALRPVLQESIEVGDRLAVLLLGVVRLADPVLRVVGEVGRTVGLKVFLEALDRERVPPLRVVGVGRVVELGGPGRRPFGWGDMRVLASTLLGTMSTSGQLRGLSTLVLIR